MRLHEPPVTAQKPDFVSLDGVSMAYDRQGQGTLALEGVDLSMKEGEFVAIVGPSGCGKTTLLKLVSGLAPALRGSVSVAGKPVKGPLRNVGMAFQNASLLPWRTTLANVLLPLEIAPAHKRSYRKNPRPYVAAARELLAAVGLAGFEDKHPWELSGGMQQRASLCRALIHEPEILLLDEPFAALDAFTREELWLALQTLWETRRCTVMLVTHELREAVFLATTVYVMSKRPGRIVSRTEVTLPRPRDLEDPYRGAFTDLVHDLRLQIARVQR
ncbi:MAG: ABC transporter ATP-binding protein [Deinococcota bacterium]|jgi:NitT/TauT family transport system ATP-binding protein|nr:ABC transporter ATP-binding protein [Deinococcota bacterium]